MWMTRLVMILQTLKEKIASWISFTQMMTMTMTMMMMKMTKIQQLNFPNQSLTSISSREDRLKESDFTRSLGLKTAAYTAESAKESIAKPPRVARNAIRKN